MAFTSGAEPDDPLPFPAWTGALAFTNDPDVEPPLLVDPPVVPAWTGAVALTRPDWDPPFEPDALPLEAPLLPAWIGALAFTNDPDVDESLPLNPPLEPAWRGAVALIKLDGDPPFEPDALPLEPAWTGALAFTSVPPCDAVGGDPPELLGDPGPVGPGPESLCGVGDIVGPVEPEAAVGPVAPDAAVGPVVPGPWGTEGAADPCAGAEPWHCPNCASAWVDNIGPAKPSARQAAPDATTAVARARLKKICIW